MNFFSGRFAARGILEKHLSGRSKQKMAKVVDFFIGG